MQIVGVNCVPGGAVIEAHIEYPNIHVPKKARLGVRPVKASQFTNTVNAYDSLRLERKTGYYGSYYATVDTIVSLGSNFQIVENSAGTFTYDDRSGFRTYYTQSGDIITVEFSTLIDSPITYARQLVTDVQVVVENGVKKFALTKETVTFNKVL